MKNTSKKPKKYLLKISIKLFYDLFANFLKVFIIKFEKVFKSLHDKIYAENYESKIMPEKFVDRNFFNFSEIILSGVVFVD